MAHAKLTATAVKKLSSKEKSYKVFDGGGLYIVVKPNGRKYWRYSYRYLGVQQTISVGVYPEVSLAEARKGHQEMREQLRNGQNPTLLRKNRELLGREAQKNTFESIGWDWFATKKITWSEQYSKKMESLLRKDVFPVIGKRPIGEIKSGELLKMLELIQERGVYETARRAKQLCGQIFRYAAISGKVEFDPTQMLINTVNVPPPKHFPAIREPAQYGEFLRAVDGYRGNYITRCALQLAALVFLRPGEIRQAKWSEFDFENARWTVPAERMKAREQHIVPLSRQAIEILRKVQAYTGGREHVFPGVHDPKRCMSENTLNAAIRRLGYANVMTSHGFRASASTMLHEQFREPKWDSQIIEAQLAHKDPNKVRAAYNRSSYLDDRTKMMQAWADYLDQLRSSGTVVSINKKAA